MNLSKNSVFFYYICFEEESIFSKINDQIDAFEEYKKLGLISKFECIKTIEKEYKKFDYLGINKCGKVKFKKNNNINHKLYNYVIATRKLHNLVIKYLNHNKYTHIYIRRAYADYNFLRFIKKLKKRKIKIVYEIPTYPYDGEMNNKSIIYKVDVFCRRKFKKYIDRIVTYSKDKCIFGIKTIININGININKVSLYNDKRDENNGNSIDLIAVAGMHEWHGYERLIEGLHNYYKNGGRKNIYFHLVGGNEENINSELEKYKEMVNKYSLEKYVIFYGKKTGNELELIYKKALIAVSSLGFYKIQLDTASSLKTKEYALHGLPMITTGDLEFLPKNYKYILTVSNDSTPIDIEKIIEFNIKYKIAEEKNKIAEEIRDYVLKSCDMKKTMMPIINYINNEDYEN